MEKELCTSCSETQLKIWDYKNNSQEKFYNNLTKKKGSKETQEWFNDFDRVIKTIKIL